MSGSVKSAGKRKSFWDDVDSDPRFNAALDSLHGKTATQNPPPPHEVEAPSAVEQTAISDGLIANTSYYQTVKPSDSPTVTHSDSQTVQQSDTPTVQQSEVKQPPTVKQSDAEIVRQSEAARVPQTPRQTVPLQVLNLAYNQASILEFLIQKSAGMAIPLTNYKEIFENTNITMPSARDALARLVTRGFMAKPVTYRSSTFQGFSFVLNKGLCDMFVAAGGLAANGYQTVPQTVKLSDGATFPFSSSSEKLTTTTIFEALRGQTGILSVPDKLGTVLTTPEMAYWQEAGLQEPMAQKWCQEFELTPEVLRQQLAWARWDLLQNEKEQTVQTGVVPWMYGALKRSSGCYPRPGNYRSPE